MITDPVAVRFSTEVIRTLAERVRAIKVDIDAARRLWDDSVSALIPSEPANMIVDGLEGATQLSGQDAAFFMGVLSTIQTALDQPGIAPIVSKPCVKMLVTR